MNTKNEILVSYVLNDFKVALNIGSDHGVAIGDRFQIYELTDNPIIDPKTHENLGFLEISKGTGKVVSVQEKLCVIESDMKKVSSSKVVHKSPILGGMKQVEEYIDTSDSPFSSPSVGDCAKQI